MADDKKNGMEKLFEQSEGAGFDTMEGSDFSAPFLTILQQMSPQLNPANQKYLPAARAGMIFNTQSLNVYSKVTVIPVKYEFKMVEWKARNIGGGFVSSYTRFNIPDDLMTDPVTGNTIRPNGDVINQTAYYLAILEEESWDKVIINMTSTQLKKSRKWNSMMAAVKFGPEKKTVPMFGCKYTLQSVVESNQKGTWWGWSIGTPEFYNDETLFFKAREANQIVEFLPQRVIAASKPDDDDSGNNNGAM